MGAQINRLSGEQSGVVGMISFGRMIGGLANAFDPGSGDGVNTWAEGASAQLRSELNDAVMNGQVVSIEGWDTGLPAVRELQRQLDAIER